MINAGGGNPSGKRHVKGETLEAHALGRVSTDRCQALI